MLQFAFKFETASSQETILSLGVFRRETASGFYPWGKVEGPRKRVAERLCGWRHRNSFPMTQSAQSHRQMRSIPLCPKAVFMFLFLIPFTIRQHCIIYAQKFSNESLLGVWGGKDFMDWAIFWIYWGVVPQQPPTMLSRPSFAIALMWLAMKSGVS